jgi:hypothetical protein
MYDKEPLELHPTEIVVAKYKENTDWTALMTDVTIYDKGTDQLPNVGREAQTYVHHIIQNYDDLADVTVFLQGDPFAHVHDVNEILDLAEQARAHPSGLSHNARVHDVGNNDCYMGFTIHRHGGQEVKEFMSFRLGEWWTTIVGRPWPKQSPPWYIGACFAATKEAIRSVPMKTWESINESLSYDQNPVTAHYMERSWYMLLDQEALVRRPNIL